MPPLEMGVLDAPDDAAGSPLLLPIELIDEDPAQPRHEFDELKLKQLAETVAARGVRVAISVRPHPDLPGRWMVNSGARRLRASRIAGRCEIPAFIDRTFDSYDQVIENEQRDNLKPVELAMFIDQELKAGHTRTEIAKRLGKSPAYITYVSAMIDPPDWLLSAYREGRCRGVLELYELRRLHEKYPQKVEQWVRDRELMSRDETAALRQECESGAGQGASEAPGREVDAMPVPTPTSDRGQARGLDSVRIRTSSTSGKRIAPASRRARPVQIVACVDGADVLLVLDRVPNAHNQVFVITNPGESWSAVSIDALQDIRARRA